jgi:SIT4-associating protein SAP185/190
MTKLNSSTSFVLPVTDSNRYSYVSCEVLSCEIWSICETVVQNRGLLLNFWKFLDRPPPLNPLQASYFTKVNEQFLEKKTDDVQLQ